MLLCSGKKEGLLRIGALHHVKIRDVKQESIHRLMIIVYHTFVYISTNIFHLP